MADMRGSAVICNQGCGCPVPCPGGLACRCRMGGVASSGGGDDPSIEHKRCSCGEHCGCNPCTCPKTVSAAAGCKCGQGCACPTCSA